MYRTDEELVALAAKGEPDAFDQLVSRWERQIYFLAYRMLGREEDARDVTQEAFLSAFRGLKGFKRQSKFSSWLYRIALNLCRDWLRRARRASAVRPSEDLDLNEQAIVDPISETVEDLIVRRDLGRAVSKEMAALSEEQRTVIEHVAAKLARLDFALQRAEAATRELREERALASRIYKGIQQKDQRAPRPAE